MIDEGNRSVELEQARALLRAIEPPEGAKQRVEQALLLQNTRDRVRTGWRWGIGIAFLAATSAAAVGDYIPVQHILQVVQGGETPTRVNPKPKTSTPVHNGVQHVSEQPTEPKAPELAIPTAEPTATSHATAAAASRPHATKAPMVAKPLPPSELARLVTEFEQAKALSQDNPAGGLAAFRHLQQRWPHSPLSPEIDLQVVSLLNRLGKHDESERESAAFVRHHPENPRAKELQHALQAGEASEDSQQSKQ
jgi:hypothetical protein